MQITGARFSIFTLVFSVCLQNKKVITHALIVKNVVRYQQVWLLYTLIRHHVNMITAFAVYITKFNMYLPHIYRSLLYSIEIVEDLPNVDVVMVPCGGGGLIGGIALYLKHFNPSIQVRLLHASAD